MLRKLSIVEVLGALLVTRNTVLFHARPPEPREPERSSSRLSHAPNKTSYIIIKSIRFSGNSIIKVNTIPQNYSIGCQNGQWPFIDRIKYFTSNLIRMISFLPMADGAAMLTTGWIALIGWDNVTLADCMYS